MKQGERTADKKSALGHVEVCSKFDLLFADARRLSAVHQLNTVLSYSRAVVDKVNGTPASNAFTVIQNEMIASIIVGVCRLWDSNGSNRCSLVAVVKAMSTEGFRRDFEDRIYPSWVNKNKFADFEARWAELKLISEYIEGVRNGSKYKALRHYRDTYIAHVLDGYIQSRQGESLPGVKFKYGDEEELFLAARDLIVRLSHVLTDGHVNFDGIDSSFKSNAEMFAKSISFKTNNELWSVG